MGESNRVGPSTFQGWITGRASLLFHASDRFFTLALAGIALLVSLHLAFAGAVRQEIYCHDVPLFYDGGWRVYCGLKPSADFYSPLGPIIYLYVAAGYCLFGVNANSFGYMNAISFPAFMALSWYSLKSRIPSFWLFCLVLLISLCLVSEHPLREDFWRSTYAGAYNRHGYAWLMLLVLLVYSPVGSASPFQLKGNSLLAGLIFSILLFLKISYFISALPLLFFQLILKEKSALNPFLVASGFLGLSFLFLAYLDFDVAAILRDLSVAAGARAHAVEPRNIATDLQVMKWQVVLLVMVVILTWDRSRLHSPRLLLDDALFPAVILGISLMVYESNGAVLNSPLDELPLIPLLLVLLVVRKDIQVKTGTEQAISRWITGNRLLCYSLCLVSGAFYLLPDAASILCSVYKVHWRPSTRFASDSMRELIFDETTLGPLYTARTNDGLQLLRDNNLTNLRITALDYTIPFSFALKSPPPMGAPTY